jgi:hypothetical protein
MGPEEDDLPSKCRVTDAASNFPQNSSKEPAFKTIQSKGSPETYSL